MRHKVVHELQRAKKSYVNSVARPKTPNSFGQQLRLSMKTIHPVFPHFPATIKLSQIIKGKLRF